MSFNTDQQIIEASNSVRNMWQSIPSTAVILGSGLGSFEKEIIVNSRISTSEIPHHPAIAVQSHAGTLIHGSLENRDKKVDVLLVSGRAHFYEHGSITAPTFQIRLLQSLGVRTVFISNAAGGVNTNFRPGMLMLITDYLDLTTNRLTELIDLDEVKPEHIRAYSHHPKYVVHPNLRKVILDQAAKLGIPLAEGTYCWLNGPSYETAAEIRMLGKMGADAVGMSTVPELYLGSVFGMEVVGISVISNLGTGLSDSKLTHSEVMDNAKTIEKEFASLIKNSILAVS